jgi:MYXO-CTERM domain-containing protein
MKRLSVTVATLAMLAAGGCDDGVQSGLSRSRRSASTADQSATDSAPQAEPDQAANTTGNVAAGEGVPTTKGAATPAPQAGSGSGKTAVLNTYSRVWVTGDEKGPSKIGRNTGAGTMDASFNWNQGLLQTDATKVELLTTYTRSDDQPNGNGSYLQGGVAFATLTDKGVVPGEEVALPRLDGNRTWMRPIAGFLSNGRALLMAASEDNGVNANNPQPVAFIVDTQTGQLLTIPNSTRGENVGKPTNLIQQALRDGISVVSPKNQRGPHTIAADPNQPDTYLVGMQSNNDAQEAYSVTVDPDNSIHMNWLARYSNTAQHCRPQVVVQPGSTIGYVAAVEANNQPAEIGFRVTRIDTSTGKALVSKIVVRSQPDQNKYVSEPVIGLLSEDKLAITYGLSSKARDAKNGAGHAGGRKIDAAVLVDTADLSVIGTPVLGVGQYGRHGSSFITNYGPTPAPALAVISGSSTGTGPGFIQMYPLKSDGTLGVKDQGKVYQVAAFSDVANLQARGKGNPNNQARGFINGMGNVPNPGFTTDPAKATTSFMPQVKTFSFSTVTGYGSADAMAAGLKESVWLSLVPSSWQEGLQTLPGKATDKPGTNEDGTGPAPRSTALGTNPSGEDISPTGSADADPDGAGDATSKSEKSHDGLPAADRGCSAVPAGTKGGNLGLIALAMAGALGAMRRRRRWIEPYVSGTAQ